LERWRYSTFPEFNYAVAGYWRNWERFAAIPMREICYVQIVGNPNIRQGSKPRTVQDYMRLSVDKEVVRKPLMTKDEYSDLKAFRDKVVWQNKN
jgi:hypothetical protein